MITITATTNIPARRTRLIGRERDLADVRRLLLDGELRLVTLTGAGGTGKTSLALEAARSMLDDLPDGIWLIRIDPLTDLSAIAQSACAALGLNDHAGASPVDVLVTFLALRDALLVLDNCEHLAGACAELIDTLLSACPNLRVLATSRVPLNIRSETVVSVPTLATPPAGVTDPDRISPVPAVELFVARALAARSGFVLNEGNASAVARICTRLDGLPLAIELAAASVRLLSCDEIADRLESDIPLLAGSDRSAPERHRTLEAALDWSYGLLSGADQSLFRRVGVFASGWNLRSLESISERLDGTHEGVVEALGRLIDHSLAVAEEQRGGMRYRLLEPVRVYSLEKLRAGPELERASDAHTRHYTRYAHNLAAGAAKVHSDAESMAKLAQERENIERAWEWARHRGDASTALRICIAMLEFDRVRGHLRSGLRRMEAALALEGEQDPALRANVLLSAADVARLIGENERAGAHADEAERLYRLIGYDGGICVARAILGDIAANGGDYERARALYDEAFTFLDPSGDDQPAPSEEHRARAWWYSNVGIISFRRGQLDEAEPLLEEGARRMREIGAWYYGGVLMYLGRVALARDNSRRATDLLAQALAWLQPYRASAETAECVEVMAEIALHQRQASRAATLLGAASMLRDSTGLKAPEDMRGRLDAMTERAHHQLGLRAFADAWSRGRVLSYDEVLAAARDAESSDAVPATASTALQTLTRREREVADLVAEGLTNRQIAERLSVSEGTARTHVERILDKLGVHSRVQVATLVTEHAISDLR